MLEDASSEVHREPAVSAKDRTARIAELRAAIGQPSLAPTGPVISTGFPQLDRLLPQNGFRAGWLIEWLTEPGVGGALLSLRIALHGLQTTSYPALAIVDHEHTFYPPAVVGWGIPLEQLLILRPRSTDETLWTWEELLRSRVFPIVWGTLPQLSTRWFRRLQLACESSGGWGMLLRSYARQGHPTWSAVQWRMDPLPSRDEDALLLRRWRVTLLRCRGRSLGPVEFPAAEVTLRGTLEPGTVEGGTDDDF